MRFLFTYRDIVWQFKYSYQIYCHFTLPGITSSQFSEIGDKQKYNFLVFTYSPHALARLGREAAWEWVVRCLERRDRIFCNSHNHNPKSGSNARVPLILKSTERTPHSRSVYVYSACQYNRATCSFFVVIKAGVVRLTSRIFADVSWVLLHRNKEV